MGGGVKDTLGPPPLNYTLVILRIELKTVSSKLQKERLKTVDLQQLPKDCNVGTKWPIILYFNNKNCFTIVNI